MDRETGYDIINPYITIYSVDEWNWISLNTETFKNAQKNLISLHDDKTCSELDEKSRLYKIVATVAKQNFMFGYQHRDIFSRNVRVEGASDAVALIPLGYLLEEIVKEQFPKSFEYFEKKRIEHQNNLKVRL